MPRPKKPGAPEPKRRSRNGCWPCKTRKVKCGEEHPTCFNCQRTGEICDYSVRLNWEGRRTKRSRSFGTPTRTTESLRESTQMPQPSFNHTFAVGAKIQSKPIPRRVQTAPGGIKPVEGKQDCPDADVHHVGAPSPDSFFSASPQAPYVLSPAVTRLVDSFSSASNPRRSIPGTSSPSQRSCKRTRSPEESSDFDTHRQPNLLSSPVSLTSKSPSVSRIRSRTDSSSREFPLTPISSCMKTEDEPNTPLPDLPSQASPANSRLSVYNLLTESSGLLQQPTNGGQYFFESNLPYPKLEGQASEIGRFYGFDLGIRDADINDNDDSRAISKTASNGLNTVNVFGDRHHDLLKSSFRAGASHTTVHVVTGGYYDQPVSIWIPRSIEPLPSKLQDNPMNLLYFHHFMNHTAKVLVPYDDPNSNPFRTVLPQMAARNEHLLSLLLAYSASHRARLLRQREPEMRIAHWVQDIFPALRLALNDREQIISNTNLATAIMLASLEIISPTAFGYEIPWQTHLNLARDLMRRRLTDLQRTRYDIEEDRVCSFLCSWLAYLDVLGSLSGGAPGGDPSGSWVLDYAMFNNADDQNEIDCIMGFTNRCVKLLAQTSELAHHCDTQRIGPDKRVRPNWIPTPNCMKRAQQLERELMESIAQPFYPCKHIRSVEGRDREEMLLTNEAFHWAGLVHLHSRVYGKSSGHADVQGPVQRIITCMGCIRPGGTAETGFLFPMFTAGCNTLDEGQRTSIMQRFISVESKGMTQVHKARMLMEKVWVTGQPWEPLLCTDFIG